MYPEPVGSIEYEALYSEVEVPKGVEVVIGPVE